MSRLVTALLISFIAIGGPAAAHESDLELPIPSPYDDLEPAYSLEYLELTDAISSAPSPRLRVWVTPFFTLSRVDVFFDESIAITKRAIAACVSPCSNSRIARIRRRSSASKSRRAMPLSPRKRERSTVTILCEPL